MKSKKVRQITDASVIVAIYALIFLLSRFSGELIYSITFLLPLPLAIYGYKYDFKKSLIPFIASIAISFLVVTNPISVLVINIPYLLIGLLLGGLLIKKDIKPIFSILIITAVTIISEVLSSVILYNLLGLENMYADIEIFIDQLRNLFGENEGVFVVIQTLLEMIIPSVIVVVSLMSSLTTYLLYVVLLTRVFKYTVGNNLLQIFSLKNLINKWISLVYVVILISGIVGVFFVFNSDGVIKILLMILINSAIIFGAVYLYFGLKVSAIFIKYIKKPWLIIIEFLLILVCPLLFVILGLLDSFFSLQEKIHNKIKYHQ